MYIIMSSNSNKVLQRWSFLEPCRENTLYVEDVRQRLQVHYPSEQLIVLHSTVADEPDDLVTATTAWLAAPQ